MAGITAASASNTLLSGATSADKTSSGWVAGERVTLATTPTGTDYAWAIAQPSASSRSRSALSAETGASVMFTPDVGGTYAITCIVDSTTTYVLRLTCQAASISEPVEAIRFSPRTDASIPAPAAGWSVYFSSTLGTWVAKDPSDRICPLGRGKVGAALTDASATIQITEGNLRPLPSALTANRTVTLGTTGAALGHVIEIPRFDVAAFTLAIVNGGPGAGTLYTFPVSATGHAVFRFDATNWALWELRALS